MLIKNRNTARKVTFLNCFHPEPVTIVTFLFSALGGIISHTLIFLNLPQVLLGYIFFCFENNFK